MKNVVKVLCRGFSSLCLAAVLMSGLPGVGSMQAQAAKIVAKKALGAVTNVKYDPATQRASWDKVAGATSYRLVYKDDKGATKGTRNKSDIYDEISFLATGTYTLTIYAQNNGDDGECYLVAANVADLSDYEHDTSIKNPDGTYNLYDYVKGPETTITFTVPADTSTTSITKVSGIEIKEKRDNQLTVRPKTVVPLLTGESLIWEYANTPDFKADVKSGRVVWKRTITKGTISQETTISYSWFTPGDTIYVRARVWNENYAYVTSKDERFGAYTPTLTFKIPENTIDSLQTTTSASEITLEAMASRTATGYQFAKKVGSKWVTLETQTDRFYTDKAVNKNTPYEYRVRAYNYNKYTKKTIWTQWYYAKASTWGTNLDFRAQAASATSVKLTWKPVSGAEGYEIYRMDTISSGVNTVKGVRVDGFESYTLLKTIKKQKTKSYTDKKLKKNTDYFYWIRAYKTIGKQKYYLDGSDYVSLKADGITVISDYVTSAGKEVLKWKKMTGIKGYYLQLRDQKTGDYNTIKTLKASATSYTFDAVALGTDPVTYRIAPFDANKTYDGYAFDVWPSLAAPKNVKAVKTANGVKVSWSAVPGADYYRVYRTEENDYTYFKTENGYNYDIYADRTIVYEAAVNTKNCHPELNQAGYQNIGTYYTEEIRTTSVEDKAVVYLTTARDENGDPIKIGKTSDGKDLYQTEETFYEGIEGPEPGTTYHYYVVAYKDDNNGQRDVIATNSYDSKAATITYTNLAAKKVSKITSVKSTKKGQATVSFKKVKGVDGYAIYRSKKKKGTYVLIGCVDKKKASFTDGSAPAGKTAYYKVASYI
ncbi:MAG: fibronectin type III domain-containing protein, partial [Lachnospiraceae bacterium]|nr:fibronectin type III domain-containing protein [Lachnospiraceae bacterium]